MTMMWGLSFELITLAVILTAALVQLFLRYIWTKEPGICETQTETMRNSHVQLVVPAAIQASYTDEQRDWLYSVADLLIMIAERQAQIP